MAVINIEASQLGPDGVVLKENLEANAGEPNLVVISFSATSDAADLESFIRTLPALTIGVGARKNQAKLFDLVTTDSGQGQRWIAGYEKSPLAAWTAALLLRDPSTSIWGGITAESTAYSTLLAGEMFNLWRSTHSPLSTTAENDQLVEVEVRAGIRIITLNRPERHNALNPALRDALYHAFTTALAADEPVVWRGNGPSFCSGGDLYSFGTAPDPAQAHVIRITRSLAWLAHSLAPRLVVGIHGASMGAGIEIPAFASRVIAADNTQISLPELRLGLIPGAGGTVSMTARSGSNRVLELLLDGTVIDASRAHNWRLVDDVVAYSDLDDSLIKAAEARR